MLDPLDGTVESNDYSKERHKGWIVEKRAIPEPLETYLHWYLKVLC